MDSTIVSQNDTCYRRLLIYIFYINVLALKFDTYVINIKKFLFQKFHGKKKKNQPLGGCQSWQQ